MRDTLARVAQVVEQATENRCVGGSNPSSGTTFFLIFLCLQGSPDNVSLVPTLP